MRQDANPPPEGKPPAIWDPVVRLSHWVIAGVVLGNALFTKAGGITHVWFGWIGMSFLVLRLVWGFVGPVEARFASFPLRPQAALAHLKQLACGKPREYRSHNPAGAAMVYALWSLMAALIVSGLMLTGGATPFEVARQKAAVASGDWAALAQASESDDEGADKVSRKVVEGAHEIASNLLIALVVLHLGGVLVESAALRRNLVRPMLLGARRD